MTTHAADLTAVVERLEKLEQQNARLARQDRWLKRTGFAVLILGGAVLFLGPIGAQQDRTQTKTTPDEFVLRDAQGRERARMALGKEGANIIFSDENNKPRSTLSLGMEGGMLRYLDDNGNVRSGLSVEPDGIAVVSLGRDGKALTGTDAFKNNGGRLLPGAPMVKPIPPRP
jgi:hypothetical protein